MADQNETIKLLKECDAGVKMGIQSLEDVLTGLKDGTITRAELEACAGRILALSKELS